MSWRKGDTLLRRTSATQINNKIVHQKRIVDFIGLSISKFATNFNQFLRFTNREYFKKERVFDVTTKISYFICNLYYTTFPGKWRTLICFLNAI